MRIRTNYDNLHVSPEAYDEEIRKAYRYLSKQYHPDLNPDADANRIMQLINQAYDVLSDP
ncbi:MAG: DnaJ domain-containing protein, partial [Neisseriaceae bacterium]|nr:DnaJ domain-containing protein [Neisseriaceae bacterium]